MLFRSLTVSSITRAMGSETSRCCGASEAKAGASNEHREPNIAKETGLTNLPFEDPGVSPLTKAPGKATPDSAVVPEEYYVSLDKTTGEKLGIDVDHQDGQTLLIECINGGLVEAWNRTYKYASILGGSEEVMADLAIRQQLQKKAMSARL